MSEIDDLVTQAQEQLDQHKKWLVEEIAKLKDLGEEVSFSFRTQAAEIKVRVVRHAGKTISVVYDYPDELHAWLRSEAAPAHLRASLEGGHVVDPNQSTFSARREEP